MVSVLVIALVSGPWNVRWLPCPEATTLASRRVRSSDRRVRPPDPLRAGGSSRRRYVSRSPLILNGSTRCSMLAFALRAATREDEALFGEIGLHDAYTAISQIPIRFADDRRDMTSKQLVNGGGA